MRGVRTGIISSGIARKGTLLLMLSAVAILAGPATLVSARTPKPDPNAIPLPKVGTPLIADESDRPVLLIPVRYPLEAAGMIARGQVRLKLPGRPPIVRRYRVRLHAGPLRQADSRRMFGFTHAVRLAPALARRIDQDRGALRFQASIRYVKPASTDGLQWTAAASGWGVREAKAGNCGSVPLTLATAGKSSQEALPVCGLAVGRWALKAGPKLGKVNISPAAGTFRYTPSGDRFGEDSFTLESRRKGRPLSTRTVRVRVSPVTASRTSVIAFGDSVTAGFGYFGATGKPMTIGQLYGCKPGSTFLNDACSSNSYNRKSAVGKSPDYLPDYGLSRNISWAAQWANRYGITNFKNLAVTGSAPADWLAGGAFNPTLKQIEAQNPDYILMTLGANPLLSNVLFNVDTMGCALESDLFGDFRQCVLDAFAAVNLGPNMNAVFTELVQETTSKIVLMAYPLTIPSSAIAYSATQLEMMESILNEVVAGEAAQASSSRITVVNPPRFNVGIDMSPMYKPTYSCSFLGYKVDGPSVQSTPTQDELELDHPLSFCSGPPIGPPWVISGDTGIHPSAAGYSQMAGQIPAPGS